MTAKQAKRVMGRVEYERALAENALARARKSTSKKRNLLFWETIKAALEVYLPVVVGEEGWQSVVASYCATDSTATEAMFEAIRAGSEEEDDG